MTDSSENLSSSSIQPKGATGVKRIILATGYSINGLRAAWRNESAIRQEMVGALILVPLALFLSVTMVEKILMIGSVLLVLIVELINSAIEAVVDRIGAERHELSGRAKDMGSAAVLVALSLAMFTWIGILI
ncbi:diacylglycerol kinase [Hahella sp. KA22]|uniref:diacylglycerol kinase n=1 Tax=Hahella sp. KA22 TaxID=1628392 RepID=UPI000FDF32B2|nr:diacylglycerol kinase [Hahella sp. KA22]AZZ91249.1 diacylglycerol kinase [Hahella sp. KA22]QAY54617.1 diacylglycerol kinase [Hahella sp. KA22]